MLLKVNYRVNKVLGKVINVRENTYKRNTWIQHSNKTRHGATGAWPWAAAEPINSRKAGKRPSENPSSRQKPQLHPHHWEGQEGGVWGAYTIIIELKYEFINVPRPCGLSTPVQRISADYDALLKDHEDVKKKLEASKVRNKCLSTEMKSLKVRISTLLVKDKHDNELVEALLVRHSIREKYLIMFIYLVWISIMWTHTNCVYLNFTVGVVRRIEHVWLHF